MEHSVSRIQADQAAQLAAIGAEPLDGSGFESEAEEERLDAVYRAIGSVRCFQLHPTVPAPISDSTPVH